MRKAAAQEALLRLRDILEKLKVPEAQGPLVDASFVLEVLG